MAKMERDRPRSAAKFNRQAQEALQHQLAQALKTTSVISNEILSAWDPAIHAFSISCEKYLSEWLSAEEIVAFIFEEAPPILRTLNEGLKKDSIRPLSGKKSEVLAGKLMQLFSEFPRSYEIFFPLPQMQLTGDVLLSKTVSLVSRESADPVPSLSAESVLRGILPDSSDRAPSSTTQRMFLKVATNGYATTSRAQSAIQNAIALLKRSVKVALIKNAFALDGDYPGFMTLRTGDDDPVGTHPALTAIVLCVEAEGRERKLPLGRNLSNLLNRLSIYTTGSMRKARPAYIRPDKIEIDLASALSTPFMLLIEKGMEEHTSSLRRSFEWAFDALANDEIVHSYILTCIALEAALGEESEVGAITERLADRAAYLLGKAQPQRFTVRGDIREIYRLRSKLVHGATTTISNKDQSTRKLGRKYLDQALTVELNALEKWAVESSN